MYILVVINPPYISGLGYVIIVGKKTFLEPLIHLRQMWMIRSYDGFTGFMLRRLLAELSQTEFWCLEILLRNQLEALKKQRKKDFHSLFE